MPSGGAWMLLVLAALAATSGLPVWALLVGVATAFAALGVAAGAFDAGVLGALYPRTLNLLEHDLLQAMPLYVFIGLLLQRLPVADALYRSFARLLHRTGAASALAGLGVGLVVSPMNGSVASSSALLARLVAPRLRMAPPRALGLVSAAATIGVVVPPSLVLLLLGDAMMRAHTEAGRMATGALRDARTINTQDVLHAALLPACFVLLLWILVAWWQGRTQAREPAPALSLRDVGLALGTVTGVGALLAGVFLGRLLAVEAAATGCCVLLLLALATRSLDAAQWQGVLLDTLALSGALFALLVGATTFSLVFGLYGTGDWLARMTQEATAPPMLLALLLLLAVGACACVLDAFEMIFVIVPVVAPLIVLRLGDAQQAAVLLLLVLQLGFLVPPMGYAVLMARAQSGLPAVRWWPLLRALAPYLLAQLSVTAAVFALPSLVHLLDAPTVKADAPASDEEIERSMREMSPPLDGTAPADEGAAAPR